MKHGLYIILMLLSLLFFSSCEEKLEGMSDAQKMEYFEQPIAAEFFHAIEKVKSLDLSLSPLLFTSIAVILCCLVGVCLHCRKYYEIRWWAYLLMVAFVTCEMIVLFFCNYEAGFGFDFWPLNLVLGILVLVTPLVQYASTMDILSYSFSNLVGSDEQEFVESHFAFSLLGVIPILLCFWVKKNWVDYSIILYLIVQLVYLAVIIVKSIKGKSIFAILAYVGLYVVLVVPFILASVVFAKMYAMLIMTAIVFLAPICSRGSRNKKSYDLRDDVGRYVDTISSDGWSTHSGNKYSKDADGWHET